MSDNEICTIDTHSTNNAFLISECDYSLPVLVGNHKRVIVSLTVTVCRKDAIYTSGHASYDALIEIVTE